MNLALSVQVRSTLHVTVSVHGQRSAQLQFARPYRNSRGGNPNMVLSTNVAVANRLVGDSGTAMPCRPVSSNSSLGKSRHRECNDPADHQTPLQTPKMIGGYLFCHPVAATAVLCRGAYPDMTLCLAAYTPVASPTRASQLGKCGTWYCSAIRGKTLEEPGGWQ